MEDGVGLSSLAASLLQASPTPFPKRSASFSKNLSGSLEWATVTLLGSPPYFLQCFMAQVQKSTGSRDG